MSDERVCLDLFAGLGGFSQAFADSPDWEVVTVDIQERFDPDICADVLDLRPDDLPAADVVLASPPCKEFSPAQNLNGDHDVDPDAVALVYHALGLIKATSPDYWFLENPRGRLRSYLGQPTATVTYCQYGEDHQKPTDLWGDHPDSLSYRSCHRGAACHTNTRDGCNAMREAKATDAERAKVPQELSAAIRQAIDDAYANPPPEQTTLVADGGEPLDDPREATLVASEALNRAPTAPRQAGQQLEAAALVLLARGRQLKQDGGESA